MVTSVWLFKPRSHGRKREDTRARNGAPLGVAMGVASRGARRSGERADISQRFKTEIPLPNVTSDDRRRCLRVRE